MAFLFLIQSCSNAPIKSSKRPVDFYQIEGSQYTVRSLAFSTDNRILAAGGYRTIELWDVNTRKIIDIINNSGYEAFYVNDLVFHPKQPNILAATSIGNSIKIWDTNTSELVNTIDGITTNNNISENNKQKIVIATGHDDYISDIDFSLDGKILASGSWDTTIKLWRGTDYRYIKTLEIGKEEQKEYGLALVTSIDFHPNSRYLVAGYSNGVMHIWDTKESVIIASFNEHQGAVTKVLFSQNGKLLATASEDKIVKLWSFNRRKISSETNLNHHKNTVSDLVFSKNNTKLFSASHDKTIKILDISNLKKPTIIDTLIGHDDYINRLALNQNNRILVSSSPNNMIKLWDLTLLNLSPLEQDYYLALKKSQQSAFYGLNDKNLKTLFKLSDKEKNYLWSLSNQQQRIKFLGASEQNKLWQRVIYLADSDMDYILNEPFPRSDIPPEPPKITIPDYIKLPIFPTVVPVDGLFNESEIEFSGRIYEVESERKIQIQHIVSRHQTEVNNRNAQVLKIKQKYQKDYVEYAQKQTIFDQSWQQKIDSHARKLSKRNHPKNKAKREAQVLKNRFNQIFGDAKIRPISGWRQSFNQDNKIMNLMVYWGNKNNQFNKANFSLSLQDFDITMAKNLFDTLKFGKIIPWVSLSFTDRKFKIKSATINYDNKIYSLSIKDLQSERELPLNYREKSGKKSFKFNSRTAPVVYDFELQPTLILDTKLLDYIKKETRKFNTK